ncbi:MAG: type II toxin-antitoxin system PemK/MazF family toxin [Chloroflexi bacterium]|nr:type II toxin-antitoxin system PemK/MazF family toxin [Chloroflexota bacterium]
MTRYKRGEVVLVSFPFTDLSGAKQRPALVVSADWFNRANADCVLVAITSNVPARLKRSELLLLASDLISAGLPKASIIRAGKIFTLQQSLIRKPLGKLSAGTLASVLAAMQDVLS